MEQLLVLGSGYATVTKCYNTCWILKDEQGRPFLIDAGGGNGILVQLEKMNIPIKDIHEMFLTHEHTDHLFGVIWLIRMIGNGIARGTYEGDFHLYCHKDLIKTLMTICELTVVAKFVRLIGDRIHFIPVEDGEVRRIHDYDVKFFDIRSTKAKQFGFVTTLHNGKRLTFCGDEPYRDHCYEYAYQTDYLLHEAFCLYEERDYFKPYEKSHSTVKDAAELATRLEVGNLLLWHTEDKNIRRRKSLYKKEARAYYKGNILVPYDLEVIDL